MVQHPLPDLSLFAGLITLGSVAQLLPAQAQIIPDNSLGTENSVVTPSLDIRGRPGDRIDGGAIRGNNLFHSFQEFNIREGRGAYFSNPDNIVNILTRVTGNNISQILGTLGVLGDANLFLINPNGIFFGPNARLDVGGSFFASTADGILFENGFEFAASNPQAPPLLTINMPIGLNLRENPGTLINQSVALNPDTGDTVGLQVPDGQTLGFVGGEIRFEGGEVTASGGRIEIGSIEQGRVNIETLASNETEQSLALRFPREATRSDVTFIRGIADVTGDNQGTIAIDAGNIEFQGSALIAGIAANSGSSDSQAGDIEINATEDINLSQSSRILNEVQTNATGQGGDIRITTPNLSVTEASLLSASTLGEGNAGSVIVNAENQVSFDGSVDQIPSGAFSRVEIGGQGQAGDVRITTNQLSVTNGAEISGSSAGEGNAGNVVIESDRVTVAGNSGIFSQVLPTGEGFGGNVRVNTRYLSLSEGATLATSTFGRGDAGNVQVNATETVSMTANSSIRSDVEPGAIGNGGNIDILTGSLSVSDSSLQARVNSNATDVDNPDIIRGNAGTIRVNAATTASFSGVRSGAFSTLELGATGSAGLVEINAGSIFVGEGAALSSSTSGNGNAGNVRLNARNFVSVNNPGSGVFSTVNSGGIGNSGTVTINTGGSLQVTNGAILESAIKSDPNLILGTGIGNAGNIEINAIKDVVFEGDGTRASTALETGAIGSGGDIEINAGSLTVRNGATLQAQTQGVGDGGNITINAPNGSVTFTGSTSDGAFPSAAYSTVEATAQGQGGNININTGNLSVTHGGQLQTVTRGQGNAGRIVIEASDRVLFEGTTDQLQTGGFSSVEAGAVGDSRGITITAGTVEVKDGATLQALVRGADQFQGLPAALGNAGDIQINARDLVSVDGDFTRIASSLDPGTIGTGGNIEINTGNLSVTNGGQLQAQTQGSGNAGNITINAGERVLFEGVDSQGFSSGAFSSVESGGIGNSGGITIRAGSLEVKEGGTLQSLVRGYIFGFSNVIPRPGNAGDIRIEVSGDTTFDGINPIIPVDELTGESNPSGAFSQIESGIQGDGGDIEITTGNLFVTNGAQLQAQMEGVGEGGDIIINAENGISFDGVGENGQSSRAITVVATLAEGNGGNINISGRNLSVTNGAQLDASINQGGIGNAGDIIINVRENALFDGAGNQNLTGVFTTVEQQALGFAGEINITSENLAVTNGAQLQALTRGFGGTGDIILNARNVFLGQTQDGNFPSSGVFTTVELGGFSLELLGLQNEANSGAIEISADNIFISDGAQVQTRTASFGDAGNISISTANLSITNRGQLQAQTQGFGNSGDIFVNAFNNISIDDSEAFTQVGILNLNGQLLQAEGEGGDINIITGNLFITNGGQLQAQTQGIGNAGNITVNAREGVFIDGVADQSFPSAVFTDVSFTQFGLFGIGDGGDISIIADNLSVTNGGNLRAETSGQGNAGSITVDARESVFFDGVLETTDEQIFTSFGSSFVGLFGAGEGGDVRINTGILFVTNGAQVDASTFGEGNAGNVIINARENVSLDNSAVFTNVGVTGVGEGGDVVITTGNLAATQGSEIQAQTERFGNAGNVIIEAEGDVFLDGSSRIFATVEQTAAPNTQGGEIRITADNLYVMNGSQLQTLTRGPGDAGTITIETRDGVSFDGIDSQSFPSSAFSSVEAGAVGEGGEIFITTDNLSITNNAVISTRTSGQGDGGNITINTNQLSLLNQAGISAANVSTFENRAGNINIETGDVLFNNTSGVFTLTTSGNGGNINLEGREVFMRNGSSIRTDAGLANLEGDGGNITVDNELLVGLESSQIAANAFLGRGGTVNITTRGLFGFEILGRDSLEEQFGRDNLVNFDPTLLSRSSITSISRTDPSLSGIIQLQTEIDPDAALVDLPQNIVDPNALIAQDPCKQGRDSSFIITGRGGIAPNPVQDSSAIPGLVELESLLIEPVTPQRNNSSQPPQQQSQKRDNNLDDYPIDSRTIVPARGWVRDENGNVLLVGYDPTKTGVQRQQPNRNICQP
ncbi:filamentous hemagglutinin N-terminal domain-containing protein [Capilliphycus salinus ALCB114379]|uniref:two-partner secretion domain-containing protein n=1 Tax=Capilliphycus salinus TaxID=2768948 RepID=UPI0039A6B2E2